MSRSPLTRRRALAVLLTLLTALAGPASLALASPAVTPRRQQQTQAAPSANLSDKSGYKGSVLVIYRDGQGDTACREATPEEKLSLGNAFRGGGEDSTDSPLIYAGAGRVVGEDGQDVTGPTATSAALLPSAGLRIVLRGTQQLQNNPTARDAFIVAANRWEAIISTQMTVVLDVDYGTTLFGQAFRPGVLGATGTTETSRRYSTVRQQLLAASPGAAETTLYNALPAGSSIPVELNSNTTSASSVRLTSTIARALGVIPDITNTNTADEDASIGFNSAFSFDFNPNDGITSNQIDFDAVVVHEIGHALGFTSESGNNAAGPLTLIDLYRFRPGAGSVPALATAPRVMSTGGTQVFFSNRNSTFGGNELGLSTGGSSGNTGDGEQSSHWKADEQSGVHIGIMDPTLSDGDREVITDNDLLAFDTFGYTIGGGATLPPPAPPAVPPANDNFANAIVLQGASGSVSGDNFDATAQAGEPDPSLGTGRSNRSVWYFWTAPASGIVTMDTIGSDYDTTLGAYTGGGFPLSIMAENDDIQNSVIRTSRISFSATANQTYRIMVNGWAGDTGSFKLNWTGPGVQTSFRISGRVNDTFGNGIELATVMLGGTQAGTTTTDAFGNYAFNNLPAGDYSLTPAKTGFLASTQVVSGLNADRVVNLVLSPGSITVSGLIRDAQNNVIPGVGYTITNSFVAHAAGANGFYSVVISPSQSTPITITPVKYGYTFSPAFASFNSPSVGNQTANFTGTLTHPIDGSDLFVTQHYRDFLGREPDAAGLNFWRSGIESCGPSVGCSEVRRIDTSAAFFFAIEFQETGVLVYRMWKAAYADIDGTPIPVRRQQFLEDSALVAQNVQVGVGNWQQQLEANKNAYANTFATRPVFLNKYGAMTNAQYVDALDANAEDALSQAERDHLVAELEAGRLTRAQVLRAVAEDETLRQSQLRKAFVLMQYFGYLRRDPDAPDFQGIPDPQFLGYNFWLGKLNQFNGSYIDAEMVKAFITSIEYRKRFNQ